MGVREYVSGLVLRMIIYKERRYLETEQKRNRRRGESDEAWDKRKPVVAASTSPGTRLAGPRLRCYKELPWRTVLFLCKHKYSKVPQLVHHQRHLSQSTVSNRDDSASGSHDANFACEIDA